ncbi:hypothetical protein ACRQ5Q_15250 [Bradyrhizobium sp. PMVTL-01]|uniref:hypothetical protein n=1 Tax=Bradyrhizobium sp. PMVTL-01 TaxID=3434999 RepID=UPI003F7094CF
MADESRSNWPNEASAKVVALDTKVGMLDSDVKQIHARIDGLETKFINVADSLSHEFRSGLQSLTKSVTERGSTKWSVIFAGASVAVSVIIAIGGLAYLPVTTAINDLKANVVPRAEHEKFWRDTERHFDTNEAWLRRIDADRRQDQRDEIQRLQRENYELRKR